MSWVEDLVSYLEDVDIAMAVCIVALVVTLLYFGLGPLFARDVHQPTTQPQTEPQQQAVSTAETVTQRSANVSSAPTSIEGRLRKGLGGATSVTISGPNVLYDIGQTSGSYIPIRPSLLILQRLISLVNVYIIVQVKQQGEVDSVQGFMEQLGVVDKDNSVTQASSSNGKLPRQRLLFCTSEDGKRSMVRQIEPQLHFDASQVTVQELSRFISKVVHIDTSFTQTAPSAALSTSTSTHNEKQITQCASLAKFFKVKMQS